MYKYLILFLILSFPSMSFASLSEAQLAVIFSAGKIPGYSASAALTKAYNIAPTMSSAALAGYRTQTGAFLYDAVTMSLPSTATAEVTGSLATLAGSSGAKVLIRRGLGLLGPVAVAVQLGMAVKDIYDEANAKPEMYPSLKSAANVDSVQPINILNDGRYTSPAVGMPVYNNQLVLSMGTVFTYEGSQYRITSPKTDHGIISAENSNLPLNRAVVIGGIVYFATGYVDYIASNGWLYHDGIHLESYTVSPDSSPNVSVPVPLPYFENKIYPDNAQTTYDMTPAYRAEMDKMLQSKVGTPDVAVSPTTKQIIDLANGVKADEAIASTAAAVEATKAAVATAQANYNAAPSPENKLVLDKILAQQAAQVAAQAQQDALVAPPVPANTYDSLITPPTKSSIPDLLLSFVQGSPLVSMVRSFTLTTSGGSCSQPVGMIYGQNLSFDFCRWESYLMACGGVLIMIMQGWCILIVMRGW